MSGVRAYIHALQVNGRVRLETSERGRAKTAVSIYIFCNTAPSMFFHVASYQVKRVWVGEID